MLSENKLPLEKLILEVKPISEFLDGVETELLSRADEPYLSLKSLPLFNRKLWGLKYGLTIIGARTSQGKSAVVLQMAIDLALQNKRVLFLSLEMTVESMIERLFCNQMSVDNFDVLTGKLKTDAEIAKKWFEFKNRLQNIPLILTCGIGMDFQEVVDIIEHLEDNPEVIFVDYVQAIRVPKNEREVLNEYVRHFRGICIQNKIAGVLCSQANRQTFNENDKRPTLANLKGTGNLEELADCAILLHWPHFYDNTKNENEYVVDIAKQRNGRTGDYIFHYKPEFYKFIEIETNQDPFL